MGKLIFLEALARFKFLERHTVEALKYRIIIYYLFVFVFICSSSQINAI